MADLIREAPLGQIIRWMTSNKLLKYPEEEADFECPASYTKPKSIHSRSSGEEKTADLQAPYTAHKKETGNSNNEQQDSVPALEDGNHLQDSEHLKKRITNNSTVNSDLHHQHDLEKLHTQKPMLRAGLVWAVGRR